MQTIIIIFRFWMKKQMYWYYYGVYLFFCEFLYKNSFRNIFPTFTK
jgi:hypothetical protein